MSIDPRVLAWSERLDMDALAEQYELPEGLLESVMHQESNGINHRTSSAGAQGLMQFMPKTARDYGIDPNNPEQAVDGAARMYVDLLRQFDGSIPAALAAYNWGSGNMAEKGVTAENILEPEVFARMPEETQNYVREITARMEEFTGQELPGRVPVPSAAQTNVVTALMGGKSYHELNRDQKQAFADMMEGKSGTELFLLLSILLVLGGATQEQYQTVMAAFGFGADGEVYERGYAYFDNGRSRAYGVGRTLDGKNQSSNKLDDLHPAIRGAAEAVIADLEAQGIPVRVMSTYRSNAEQDRLYNSGRGVTKVRGGGSYHNYALAFDIAPLEVLGDKNWEPENPVWDRVGEAMKRHGFEWGGDWRSFKDRPHAQVAGISISQLRNASRGPDGHVILPESVIAQYSRYNSSVDIAANAAAQKAIVAGVAVADPSVIAPVAKEGPEQAAAAAKKAGVVAANDDAPAADKALPKEAAMAAAVEQAKAATAGLYI